MRTSRRRRGRRGALVAALVLTALVAGCGGAQEALSGDAAGPADSAGSGNTSGAVTDGLVESGSRPESGADSDRSTGALGRVNRPSVQNRAVIRNGEISLVTKEINRARVDIDDLLGRLGGYLASEDTENDRAGRPERSVLVLRVPEPAFDETMKRLGDIGRVDRADRRSEDVTTEVIDVDTRVATQEASLARLREFLERATDVDDMIRVESEIATRQAELESLKAQQKYLRDQTSMSTVTVRLRTPAAPPPAEDGDSGFLAGLQDGWRALLTVLVGAATVAGALLPFLVTLALLGVPVWLLVRTAARRRHPGPVPPPAAEAG
jgi:Domain of unknown function (DUF4349)